MYPYIYKDVDGNYRCIEPTNERLQEQINELKVIIMEMRTTLRHHIDGYPDYDTR